MKESEVESALIDAAELFGWVCMHPRPCRTNQGWRTAVSGNGAKGWPDWTLIRGDRMLFIETKGTGGKLSEEQGQWRDRIRVVEEATGGLVRWVLCDPSSLDDCIKMLAKR